MDFTGGGFMPTTTTNGTQSSPDALSALAAMLTANLQNQTPSAPISQHTTPQFPANLMFQNFLTLGNAPQQNPLQTQLLSQLLGMYNAASAVQQPTLPQLSQSAIGNTQSASAAKFDSLAGSSVNDEEILIDVLSYRANGVSVRQAIEKLHGVNNHAASSWKDYFLQNHDRIYGKVLDRKNTKTSASAKSIKREDGHQPQAESAKRSKASHAQRTPTAMSSSATNVTSSGTKRGRAGHKQSQSRKSHPRIQLDELPEPPSRSPTPPTDVAPTPCPGKVKFTYADQDYFVKSVQWQLKHDSNASYASLCRTLTTKAPHHSQAGWSRYMSRQRDLVDRILEQTKHSGLNDDDELLPISSEEDDDDDEYVEKPEELGNDTGSESGSESGFEYHEEWPDTDEDVANMGPEGGSYTDAEDRVIARYIASRPDWSELTSMQRWRPYNEKYSNRTPAALGEYYRKHSDFLDRMARAYDRKTGKHQAAKRPQGYEEDESARKRQRVDE